MEQSPLSAQRAVTLSAPVCAEHPPFSAWPTRNLVLGFCPECGQLVPSDPKIGRVLRARQLIEERGERD